MESRKCTCKSEYQDKKLGYLMRWFNPAGKVWKCTVCGATQQRSDNTPKSK